jgi:potassium efflux system protein
MRLPAVGLIVTCIAALLAGPAIAQQPIGFSEVIKAVDGRQRVNAELANAVARAEREAEEEVARLARDEARVDQAETSVAEFRKLRSDVDGRRIRLNNIEARIRSATEQLARLDERIAKLEQEVTGTPASLEEVAATVELRKLRELRGLVAQAIELQNRGRLAINRRLAILDERTALIQSRGRLTSLDETRELDRDPRVTAIREIVGRLSDDSVRFGNEAAGMNSSAPDVQARRQLLELRADTAFMLSNLRSDDVELLGIGRRIGFLEMLLSEPSVPARLLKEGRGALDRVSERVERRLAAVADTRRQLAQQSSALSVVSGGAPPDVEGLGTKVEQLATVADDQDQEARRLDAKIGTLRQEFTRRIALVEATALYQRASLPVDAEAWARLGASATRLPVQLGQGFKRAGGDVVRALKDAPAARLAAIALVLAILGTVAARGRRALQSAVAGWQPESTRSAPIAAVRDNLYTLIPVIAWLAVAWLLRVPETSTLLVLSVLAVWPVVTFLLDLSRRLLFGDPRFAESGVRRRFYAQLRWTLIISGIIAALVTVTRTLPITPGLTNLIDRSAMLCLMLLAVPGLLLPQLIVTAWSDSRGRPSPRARIAAGLSTLVPFALASAAVIGLLGYLNLAWNMTSLFFWLGVVGGIWLLLLELLADGASRLRGHVAVRTVAQGDFWTVNLFDPAYRFLQLVLTLLAGWALVQIYGWTAETPGVRHLLAFGRTPVIKLGETGLTIQDLALAVVMLVFAFWVGGWSRQVSYNLALTRIRDLGIRRSLSVFVQYVVTVLGVVLALKIIGLDLTAITVFAASLGVGIGFGMQNVVNNFISGVLLLAERPLRVGDFVTIAGNSGEVTRIGIRSLTVRTSDQKDIIIPNSAVISETFVNWTRTDDTLREVLHLRISDRHDPERTAAWIADVTRNTEGVLPVPAPKASVWEFTDAGVTIRLEYAIRMQGSTASVDARANLLRRLREALATANARPQDAAGDGQRPLTLVTIN